MAAVPLLRTDGSPRPVPRDVTHLSDRSRRKLRAASGLTLVAVCALAGALVFSRADQRRPVLVASRVVQPGEVITSADIVLARVSSSGLATLPASARSSVLGRRAASRLVPGELLIPASVSSTAPKTDQVELPMTLKAGALPPSLSRGDEVLVVTTPANDATPVTAKTAPVAGVVEEVSSSGGFGQSGSTVVSVLIPRSDLVALAEAAANGLVVLAMEPGQ